MKKMRKIGTVLISSLLLLGIVGVSIVSAQEVKRDIVIQVPYGVGGVSGETSIRKVVDMGDRGLGKAMEIYTATLFEALHPRVKVEYIPWDMWSGKAGERLLTGLATGSAPAYYYLGHIGGAPTAIAKGLVADLTEFVKDWDQKDYIPMSVWAPGWSKGRCYAIPYDGVCVSDTVWYRKDFYEEAGIFNEEGKPGPPEKWTMNDFVNISQKLTDPKKKRWGYGLKGGFGCNYELFAYIFGAPVLRPDPTGKYTWRAAFSLPQTVKVLEWYKDMQWKYKCVITGATIGWNETWRDFFAGKVAMMHNNDGHLLGPVIGKSTQFAPRAYEDVVGNAPFPKGPDGIMWNGTVVSLWGINPTMSKEQIKATWDWVNWRWTPSVGRAYRCLRCGDSASVGQGKAKVKAEMGEKIPWEYPYIYLPGYDWRAPNLYQDTKGVYKRFGIKSWREKVPQDIVKLVDTLWAIPKPPQMSAYNVPQERGGDLATVIQHMVQEVVGTPGKDCLQVAKKYEDIANKTVLNYKVKGQTMKDMKNYYTALSEFYKKNYPDYYEKTFTKLYEKYFKVW